MGCTHLRALVGATSLRVVAVVDPVAAARARAESIDPGVATFADLDQAAGAGGIDAVLIAAPSNLHRELVADARLQGCRSCARSPVARPRRRSPRPPAAAAAAGVLLQIGYWRRFVPELIELRRRILDGRARRDRARLVLAVGRRSRQPRVPACKRRDHGRHGRARVRPDPLADRAGDRRADARDLAGDLGRAGAGRRRKLAMLGELSGRRRSAFVSLGRHFALGDCVWAEVIGTRGYERVQVLWGERGDAVFLAALPRAGRGLRAVDQRRRDRRRRDATMTRSRRSRSPSAPRLTSRLQPAADRL